ncbi:CheR family methyltransferase [Lyngbya sp. PCC 8106]|uniref:CheR family methyltransferase n=1 Tax=Lyngbya sp. (strain PCC 8106) TaxID=313612 RepID=UPI0000EAC731|nr:CheR family methyltransferase [Lyngbya sp. PCC 8106]EAW38779.1 chemotaxis protein methyltransferase [Lyngbya sp. PCC 8106]
MDEILIQRFAQLISAQIGLQIRLQDYPVLSQKIVTRARELRYSHPQDYYNLLTGETSVSQNEWRQLIPLITTPESYFFRDRGQFKLLQTVILPQLIARKKESKQLQIWSAGCSTGEEPYSLSLLLQQLIPNWEEWKILILGTDINELSLEKARQGIYSAWSFRQVDSEIISKSFLAWGGGWKINPKTRKSVKFMNFNLVQGDLADDSKLRNFDLVICRNVFVYFEKHHISQAINKFYQALQPEGYLITAHSELQGVENNPFKATIFPESVIYQRPKETESISQHFIPSSKLDRSTLCIVLSPENQKNGSNLSPETHLKKNNINQKSLQSQVDLKSKIVHSSIATDINYSKLTVEIEEAYKLFKHKKYKEAIQKINLFLDKNKSNFDAYYLLGKIYANLGQYKEAISYCQKAITVDSLSVLPCYILLNIAEEINNKEEAKKLAKRIIYLSGISPSSISAYVKLAFLYEQEDNQKKAKQNYTIALELLQQLPPQAKVEYTEDLTVAELKISLISIINNIN